MTSITPPASGTYAAKPPRVEWLDLFRGLAVILMIEAHSMNSFLKPELRQTDWFGWLNFFNGLVAPSFLFIAGYAQGLAMRRRAARTVDWKRIRRLLTIALVGYALHFPWAAHTYNRAALEAMFQVDILQCLAVSLLVLLIVELVGAVPWRIDSCLCALFLIVVFVAPSLAAWRCESLWVLPFAAYVNQQTGSLFPLFPWMAFAFAGALASRIPWSRTKLPAGFEATFFTCSAVSAFVMWSGRFISRTPHPFDGTSPGFFFERLAWLLAAVPCIAWLQRLAPLRLIVFAGRQSLPLYVIHLQVLYVVFLNGESVASRIGTTQSTISTIGLFAAVCAVSLALTWLFAKVQRWRKT